MGSELTNHLWQSTVFGCAVGLLTLAFRRNRAKVRYGLWLTASLKFFVPFALLLNLGSRVKLAPVAPAVSGVVWQISEPFSAGPTRASPAPAARDWIPPEDVHARIAYARETLGGRVPGYGTNLRAVRRSGPD